MTYVSSIPIYILCIVSICLEILHTSHILLFRFGRAHNLTSASMNKRQHDVMDKTQDLEEEDVTLNASSITVTFE